MSEPQTLSARRAYALWAPSYARTSLNPLTAAVDRAVERLLPELSGLDLLDVGCGTGRWAARAASAGATVVGVDPVVEMLAELPAGLPAAVGEVSSLPFAPGTFDALMCILVLGHVPALRAPLEEICRVLADGGWAIIADVHPDGRARGWRRTFRDRGGSLHEVEWTAHEVSRIRAEAVGVGLRVEAHTEERLLESDLPDHLKEHAGIPAAYALLARRW